MSIKKYSISTMNFYELKNKATVPKFQRRLVWSEKQKSEFIHTLKKGFPFGSILIYKYEKEDLYSIIDGLQRFSTMDDYNSFPHKYIDFSEYVNQISLLIDSTNVEFYNKNYKKQFTDIIHSVLASRSNVTDYTIGSKLYTEISKIVTIPNNTVERSLEFVALQSKITNYVDQYLKIDDISIPAIEFKGDESELADVFQNLNRGGKKLTKYQVFAAQWSNINLKLNVEIYNKEILDRVVNRYIRLNDKRGIEIIDFDEDEMRKEREINLSEFCYALGILVCEKMKVFWKDSDISEDLANEIGYSTLGIVLKVENNKLHEIIQQKKFFTNPIYLEDLVRKILEEFEKINNYFEKYLRLPGLSITKFEGKTATNFQILSYFASLWNIRYTNIINDFKIETNPKYHPIYQTTLANFIYYFINDAVKGHWSGTGDKLLNEFYITNHKRYQKKISKDQLEQRILDWYEEVISKPSLRFDNISKTLFTILSSYYRNNLGSDKYDYEHIISQIKVKNVYKSTIIPAGSLGNVMLLDENYNRSKQGNNLYQSLKPGQIIAPDYLEITIYPSEVNIGKIEADISNNNYNSTITFIENRGKEIINILLNNLYKLY